MRCCRGCGVHCIWKEVLPCSCTQPPTLAALLPSPPLPPPLPAPQLASNADLYVNDAFGTAHRAHASTEGVTKYLKPSVAGFLLQKVRGGGEQEVWKVLAMCMRMRVFVLVGQAGCAAAAMCRRGYLCTDCWLCLFHCSRLLPALPCLPLLPLSSTPPPTHRSWTTSMALCPSPRSPSLPLWVAARCPPRSP